MSRTVALVVSAQRSEPEMRLRSRRVPRLALSSLVALPLLGFGASAPQASPANASSAPATGFKLRALQKVLGDGTEFVGGRQRARLGQTIDYEIIVKNTGNVALTFAALVDEKCDAGTVAGGPGASDVLPGESTTFTCVHLYTEADKAAGALANTATETGTPRRATVSR
jgi:uncharacterized repeat protein (TIGR01451 family)